MKRIMIVIFSIFLIFILFQYISYQKQKEIGCGGDWNYNNECPLGTSCISLEENPLAGGICRPYLYSFFKLFR